MEYHRPRKIYKMKRAKLPEAALRAVAAVHEIVYTVAAGSWRRHRRLAYNRTTSTELWNFTLVPPASHVLKTPRHLTKTASSLHRFYDDYQACHQSLLFTSQTRPWGVNVVHVLFSVRVDRVDSRRRRERVHDEPRVSLSLRCLSLEGKVLPVCFQLSSWTLLN